MRLRIRGAYPPHRDELHDQVRAGVGGRCIRCGHPDDAPAIRLAYQEDYLEHQRLARAPCDERCTHQADRKQRILTVHHLDGDKSNSRWWNLLALCQSCHLTIQGKVIPERPYLWEHSDWFKPYAAGFYSSFYGSEDLSREYVEANLETFLALGQPWLYPGSPTREGGAR